MGESGVIMNKTLRRLERAESGLTIVILALLMTGLVGFAALAVDVAIVLNQQRKAHVGTDAGALAGARLLTNLVQNVSAVMLEAKDVAAANGVTAAEIAAAPEGDVQVGIWTTSGTFLANQTTGGRYNAVKVSARRHVTLNFGQVVGISSMDPRVESVAMLTGLGTALSPIPFGLGISLLDGKDFVTNNIVTVDGQQDAGNWGKLDVGRQMSSGQEFEQAMQDAANGIDGTPVSVGQDLSAGTGFAGIRQGFAAVMGMPVVIPIVNSFPSGNSSPVEVLGFVVAIPIAAHSGGQNFTLTLQLVGELVGGGGGGPSGPPWAMTRALVQ
jgi:Flp pilus assembly protein TadG